MPNFADHLLVVFFAVYGPIYTARVWYPRFLREVEAGQAGARRKAYRGIIASSWLMAALVFFHWRLNAHPLASLGLRNPIDWLFWLSLGLVAAAVAVQGWQTKRLLRDPERRARALKAWERVLPFLPHTLEDLRLFSWLGVTAGICEEILFRGFLIWYLSNYTDIFSAAILSAVLFGFAHHYQGVRGMLGTSAIGFLLAALFLLTGSLYVPMVFHAGYDWNVGRLAFAVIAAPAPAESLPPAEPAS